MLAADRVDAGSSLLGAVREQACEARLVELRPRVVGHASVHGDEGRRVARVLDDADAVERDARLADERPPGLEHELWLRECVQAPGPFEPVCDRAHELVDRRRRVGLDVGDAEPAACVDHGRRPAQLRPAFGGEAGEPVHGEAGRRDVEELRAEVHVQAFDVQLELACLLDQPERLVRRQAELRAAVAGLDRVVRVGVDARRHPHEHALDARGRGPQGLVRGVEDDQPDVGFGRAAELLVRLVVAVDDDPLRRHTGPKRELELAERRHVRAQAQLGKQCQQRSVRKRLRAVERHRLPRRLAIAVRPRAEGLLAVDHERRSELVRERPGPKPPDRQLAGVDRGRVGKQVDYAHDFDATTR